MRGYFDRGGGGEVEIFLLCRTRKYGATEKTYFFAELYMENNGVYSVWSISFIRLMEDTSFTHFRDLIKKVFCVLNFFI